MKKKAATSMHLISLRHLNNHAMKSYICITIQDFLIKLLYFIVIEF